MFIIWCRLLPRCSVCNNNPEQVHQNYFPCEVMSQISGGPMFYFASRRWSPPFSTLCTEFAARSKAPPLFMRAMAQAPLNSRKIFHCNLLQCCKRLMCFDCARGLWLASSKEARNESRRHPARLDAKTWVSRPFFYHQCLHSAVGNFISGIFE